MKESQITLLQDTQNTYDSPGGTIYYFNIHFANGDTGQIGTKSQTPPYAIGDTIHYTTTPNGNHPNNIKKVNPQHENGAAVPGKVQGNFQKPASKGWVPIVESSKYPSFAVSYAKDMVIGKAVPLKQMAAIAERLFDIMINLEKKLEKAPEPEAAPAPAPIAVPPHADPKIQAPPPKTEPAMSATGDFIDEAKKEEDDDLPF